MRALLILLVLAACSEPQAAPQRSTWGQDEASTDPTRNIEAIGAVALCRDDERPVVTYEGARVTACEARSETQPAPPAPAPEQR